MNDYILGIEKNIFLNKNIIKVIDGIAGAGKSSVIHNFFRNSNISYIRVTSTHQLKEDAQRRYGIECDTICHKLFKNPKGNLYKVFKEPDFENIVIDEMLQTNTNVIEWIYEYVGKVNIIITCDSKQLLSPNNEKRMKEKFFELSNNEKTYYVNLDNTLRPVNEETKNIYNYYYELADSDNIYKYSYLKNNFNIIKFEDIEYDIKNAYICHTKEIEDYIYKYFDLSNNNDLVRIPKSYLASKTPKDITKYPLYSQYRAEKTKSLKYCQAKNVACPIRFQGSEVEDGNKLYFIIEENSKVIARELYTVITRCKNIKDFYIVIINLEKRKEIKSFLNKPIKKEKIATINWEEELESPYILNDNIFNNLFNYRFKDTDKYTYKRNYIGYKDNPLKPLFVDNNYINKEYDKKTKTIKTIIKKESSLNLSYINDIYIELEKYGIDKIKKPIIKNINKRSGIYQIDISGAYPYFLTFDYLPCDGIFSNEYNENNLNYYIYNGDVLTDNSIITENLKNYIEDKNLGVCTFVFSLPKQYGSNTGKEVYDLYHRSEEMKEKTKKEMKWGVLEKHYLNINYNNDAYIINKDCIYEIILATVYSNLTYYMLKINEIINGNFIQVDGIYFDKLENIEKIINDVNKMIPEKMEFKILKTEKKEIIYKNYEDLIKTEKEYLLKVKRDKAREKYNNMTEEEKEKLNEKRRKRYHNL